jgi:hypothetical protein
MSGSAQVSRRTIEFTYPVSSRSRSQFWIFHVVARLAKRDLVLLGAGLFFLFAAISSGVDTSEGSVHYLVTQQVLLHHRLSFDLAPGGISVRGVDGRWYLMHEIGNSIWMLPTVAVADMLTPLLSHLTKSDRQDRLALFLITFNAAAYVAAACAGCYYVANRHFGVAKRSALLAALILGLSSQMLAYSDNLYDGIAAGLLLLLAVAFAARARSIGGASLSVLSGIAIGMTLVTRVTAVLAVPALALYLANDSNGKRRLLAFGIGVVPFVVWQGWYNFIRTGSPLFSPVMLPVAMNDRGSPIAGLAGLLLSPSKSVLIYTPVLLLVPLGFKVAWTRNKSLTLLIAWVIGSYLATIASLAKWSGDWGWGPRHFALVEPLVFVFVATFLDRFRGFIAKCATACLALLGTAVNLPATLVNWHFRMTLWYDQHGTVFPYWDVRHTQWMDTWSGLVHNVAFLLGQAPPLHASSYSVANTTASNTLSVWWLSARQFGLPRGVGIGMALLLILLGVAMLIRLWKVANYEDTVDSADGSSAPFSQPDTGVAQT